jgi:hypothetical protein
LKGYDITLVVFEENRKSSLNAVTHQDGRRLAYFIFPLSPQFSFLQCAQSYTVTVVRIECGNKIAAQSIAPKISKYGIKSFFFHEI